MHSRTRFRWLGALVVCLFFVCCVWMLFSLDCAERERELPSRGKTPLSLAIVVLSSPESTRRRDVIRKTWASNIRSDSIRYWFVLGVAGASRASLSILDREQQQSNDLLLLNEVRDSYANLTYKVLSTYSWLDRNVVASLILKVDDDSFVNWATLSQELPTLPIKRFYWGFFDGRAPVFRRGKWSETEWFLCNLYLPYAVGGGYALSGDLVHFIASNADALQLYNSEDVSVGTWLAPLRIERRHDIRFNTEFRSRGCLNTFLVTHKQSPEQMEQLQSNIQRTGLLCGREEEVLRLAYVYNWTVPPSQCCQRQKLR